jgi:hypothetical protein
MLAKSDIELEFDRETQEYHVIWEPTFIGMGKTSHEALEDLRMAAHFGVNTLIDFELQGIDIRKED